MRTYQEFLAQIEVETRQEVFAITDEEAVMGFVQFFESLAYFSRGSEVHFRVVVYAPEDTPGHGAPNGLWLCLSFWYLIHLENFYTGTLLGAQICLGVGLVCSGYAVHQFTALACGVDLLWSLVSMVMALGWAMFFGLCMRNRWRTNRRFLAAIEAFLPHVNRLITSRHRDNEGLVRRLRDRIEWPWLLALVKEV